MSELTRDNCAFAQDGTCKHPPEHCAECKIDRKDSDFHSNLCVGAMTWAQVERKCRGKLKDDRRRGGKQ